MLPRSFDYFAPTSLQEAFDILSTNEDSKILAGGQSLIPLMKLRIASPKNIVDINRIRELEYIRLSKERIMIGSLARHRDFASLEGGMLGAFVDASSTIGDPQVRNLGTFCGSLAHADPSADWTAVALAFNAEVIAVSKRGERGINVQDFFVDAYTTSLQSDEIIREVRISLNSKYRIGSAYKKLERKAGDFATVGSAVVLSVDDEKCVDARIALTAVSNKPIRAERAEQILIDRKITSDLILEAGKLASMDLSPPSDIRGSSSYRKAMAAVMTKRAIVSAFERAGGELK